MDRKPVSDPSADRYTAAQSLPAATPDASAAPDKASVRRDSGGMFSRTQRVSPRTAPPCNVLVNVGNSYLMARAVHDVSLAGVFVELDPAELVLGDPVELVLEIGTGQGAVDLQLPAEVVRIDAQGVGFRFCAYSDQAYTDLVNALYTR